MLERKYKIFWEKDSSNLRPVYFDIINRTTKRVLQSKPESVYGYRNVMVALRDL